MSSWRGREALLGGVVAVGVVAWAIWYTSLPAPGDGAGGPDARDRPPGPRAAGVDHETPTPRGVDPPAAGGYEQPRDLIRRLEAALAQGDPYAVRAAARGLRANLLYADRATIEAVAALLFADSEDLRLRQALAIVLGSLPGEHAQALLADALTRCAGPPDLVRSLLLALGELKEGPGAGDFGAEDVPHGVRDPSGLAVRVRGPLRGDAAAAALFRLNDPDVETRRVAALVVRDSVAQPAVRGHLLARLPVETDDDACGEVGAALVVTAVDAPLSEAGRAEVVRAVLEVSRRPGRDVTRFRLEAGLGSATLEPAEEAELVGLLHDGDVQVQLFALEVLGRRLREDGTAAPAGEVAGAMARLLLDSPEPKVREIAARTLHPAAGDADVGYALVRALEADPAWEVRASAAQALGTALGQGRQVRPAAIEMLKRAAEGDAREEVRAAAREALTTSGR